jgi:hypothetical protein
MGWQGERCDTDVNECTHVRYSENCEARCEARSDCTATAQGLPADCSPTGFALEAAAGKCDEPCVSLYAAVLSRVNRLFALFWLILNGGDTLRRYWVDITNPDHPSGCDRDGANLLTNCLNRNGSWTCGACTEEPACCKDSPRYVYHPESTQSGSHPKQWTFVGLQQHSSDG